MADTLPPDQAQAAWSAAADPEDSSFGSVTPDFDAEAGLDGAGLAPTDADLDDGLTGQASAQPDVEAEPAVEATLSFGEGEEGEEVGAAGASGGDDDFVDDAFGDVSAGAPDAAGRGEADVAHESATPDDSDGTVADPDDDDDLDDLDDGFGASFDDSATELDDALTAPPVEHPDDTDDLAEIDGLGGIEDEGPDDLDIGSF